MEEICQIQKSLDNKILVSTTKKYNNFFLFLLAKNNCFDSEWPLLKQQFPQRHWHGENAQEQI